MGKLLVIIVSSSVRINIVQEILWFLMPFITLQNNRKISSNNSKKNLRIIAIVKDGNISPGGKHHYKEMYIHNNV